MTTKLRGNFRGHLEVLPQLFPSFVTTPIDPFDLMSVSLSIISREFEKMKRQKNPNAMILSPETVTESGSSSSSFPFLPTEMSTWLLQGGPNAAKHRGKAHPLVTFFLHYAVVAWATVAAHDWMVEKWTVEDAATTCTPTSRRQFVGMFMAVYFVLCFSWRLALRWQSPVDFYIEFYKQTFLCSVTIFHAALGLSTNRTILAQSFCVAVGIDQILWYVDLLGYLILNKFPVGVSKYLFWPGTTWASRLTSTHHLWTIPLVLWANGGSIHLLALPLSAVVVLSNVLVSRLLTPPSIAAASSSRDEKTQVHYLNLNLAYELWSDIQMPFLLVFEDTIPYLIRLIVAWCSFNALVFVFLWKMSALWSVVAERILGMQVTC